MTADITKLLQQQQIAEQQLEEINRKIDRKENAEEIQDGQVYAYYRISSAKQKDGTGEDRQEHNIKQYCKNNSIHIGFHLQDRTSAFSGKNLAPHSELGAWIAKIKNNLITNPTLIIDRIDRFSRAEVLVIIPLIYTLIGKYNVTIITTDNMKFSKENTQNFIYLHFALEGANRESKEKSHRLKGFWLSELRKRTDNPNYVMRVTPPSWIKLGRDENEITTHIFDSQKVRTIKLIIKLSCKGLNLTHIKNVLNANLTKYPTWTEDGKRWYRTRIAKILSNPAIYGLYENKTHKTIFPDYYPPVVSKSTWTKANKVAKSRAKRSKPYYTDPNKPYTMNLPVYINEERAQFTCTTTKNVKGDITGYNSYYRLVHTTGQNIAAPKLEQILYAELTEYCDPQRVTKVFKNTNPDEVRLLTRLQQLSIHIDTVAELDGEISIQTIKDVNNAYLEKEQIEKELEAIRDTYRTKDVRRGLTKSFLKKLKRTKPENRDELKNLYVNIIHKIIIEDNSLRKIVLTNNEIIHLNKKLK